MIAIIILMSITPWLLHIFLDKIWVVISSIMDVIAQKLHFLNIVMILEQKNAIILEHVNIYIFKLELFDFQKL